MNFAFVNSGYDFSYSINQLTPNTNKMRDVCHPLP